MIMHGCARRAAPWAACLVAGLLVAPAIAAAQNAGDVRMEPMIFATYADNETERGWAIHFAESLREFGGALRDAPVLLYLPGALREMDEALRARLAALRIEVRASEAPAAALAYFGGGKCHAAARAEAEAAGQCEILAWMDTDTFIFQEPRGLALPAGVSLGCTPVFHQRIGSLYGEPADAFWSRIYETLAVPAEAIFPVVTPVDNRTLRGYFNAGLLVVRPERGLLRAWPEALRALYEDSLLAAACRQDRVKWIFLHQTALAALICRELRREEVLLYPYGINYPLNLHESYPAEHRPARLDDLVTCRHEHFFDDPAWVRKAGASTALAGWLRERFGGEGDASR